MDEEFKSGTSDLIQFLRKQKNRKVWVLLASGVLSGTLDRPPENPPYTFKLIDVTSYAPERGPQSQKDVVLRINEIFSWGEGVPSFANPKRWGKS